MYLLNLSALSRMQYKVNFWVEYNWIEYSFLLDYMLYQS